MDLVSVIIPTYNRFSFLLNTIASVHAQTYPAIEIIVVNDCSSEPDYYTYDWKTAGVTMIHLDKNSKECFGFACPGGYQRNFGMKIATGKYVAFCDDDDIWLPRKLDMQLAAMRESGCKMSSTDGFIGQGVYVPSRLYSRYNSEHYFATLNNIYNGALSAGFPRTWTRDFLRVHNCVICSSVVIDREIINLTGDFVKARYADDYEYWMRVLQYTDSIYVPEPLIYYDNGHGNGQNY